MLSVLSLLPLAQLVLPAPPALPPIPASPVSPSAVPVVPAPAPRRTIEVVRPQEVRSLPGQLDDVPVFNSNSPELIQSEGILLSTFPANGMRSPEAHLDVPLEGRFDLFAHHIAKGQSADDQRTLFFGVIAYNPSNRPVTIDLLQAVSYLSQEAPFRDLPDYIANPSGLVYAGPGSRTTNDVLRGQRQPQWPAQIVIPPRRSQIIMNMPIPLRRLSVPIDGSLPPGYVLLPPLTQPAQVAQTPEGATLAVAAAGQAAPPPPALNRDVPLNGRSALMHLHSDGPVYMASLAMYAPLTPSGMERVPSLPEWEQLLVRGSLLEPRDRAPSPPDSRSFGRFYYGRVAGIAEGSKWVANVTDSAEVDYLTIPRAGNSLSYVISTVDRNTFGTGQVQSAPLVARYSDTAYRAHGNYGVEYNISLPLYNNTRSPQTVTLMMETPLQDERTDEALRFLDPPENRVFFRGTIRLRYTNDFGLPQTRYIHLVQRRGQQGQPLIRLNIPSGDRRLVEVQLVYPPDATPPQVLTVQTEGRRR